MSIENVLSNVERHLEDNHYYIDEKQLELYKEELIKSVLRDVIDTLDYHIVRLFMQEVLGGIECKKLSSVIHELQQILQHMHTNKNDKEFVFLFIDEFNQVGNYKSMTFFTSLMMYYYTKISGQSPHIIRVSLEIPSDNEANLSFESKDKIGLPNKKLVLLMFDDISYSGTQIEKIGNIIHWKTKKIENKEIRFCFSRMFIDSVANIIDYQVNGKFYCYRVMPNLPFIKLDYFDYCDYYKNLRKEAHNKLFEVSPRNTWSFLLTKDIGSLAKESKMAIIRHLQVIRIFQPHENTFPINTKLLFLEYKIPSFISVNQFILSGMILDTRKFDSLPNSNTNMQVIERSKIDPSNVQKLQRLVDSSVITKIPFVFIKHQPLSRADIKPDFSYSGNVSDYARDVTFYKSMQNMERISKYLDEKLDIVPFLKPLAAAPVTFRKRGRETNNNSRVRPRTPVSSSFSLHNAAPSAPTNASLGAAPSSSANESNIDEFLRRIVLQPSNPSYRSRPHEFDLLDFTDPFPSSFRKNPKNS